MSTPPTPPQNASDEIPPPFGGVQLDLFSDISASAQLDRPTSSVESVPDSSVHETVAGGARSSATRDDAAVAIRRGIPRAIAQALVPRGWWTVIAPLYDAPRVRPSDEIVVTACHEAEGELTLDAMWPDGTSLGALLERVRKLTEGRCMLCGGTTIEVTALRPQGRLLVVCAPCRARVEAGEDPGAVADEFWYETGQRRASPRLLLPNAPTLSATASPSVPRSSGLSATLSDWGGRSPAERECGALPPEELRQLVSDLQSAMRSSLVGQPDDVADRLALLGALHVGGGMSRGARALLIGPSGVGKTTAVIALHDSLAAAGYHRLPMAFLELGQLTAPSWAGMSIGDAIAQALGELTPESLWARKALVVIDELHWNGLATQGLTGNSLAHAQSVTASLLPLAGDNGTIRLGDGAREWSSREALVIGIGVFPELAAAKGPPTVQDWNRAGLPPELSTRLAQEVIRFESVPEHRLVRLLKQWPALLDFSEVVARLGYTLRIHEQVFTRAARAVALGTGGVTPRMAGAWITLAVRHSLLAALGDSAVTTVEVWPDSMDIPLADSDRQPPPPNGGRDEFPVT